MADAVAGAAADAVADSVAVDASADSGGRGGGDKPVDVGNGVVCASFGTDASLLSLGTPHPEHGFVELSALPPFDERHRGDPEATRRYRAQMLLERHAVLRLELDGAPLGPLSLDASDPDRPRWSGHGSGVQVEVSAVAGPGPTVTQGWRLAAAAGSHHPVAGLRLRGRLDRPPLAEITELDPPSPTGATTAVTGAGSTAALHAEALPASATISVAVADADLDAGWRMAAHEEALLEVAWPTKAGELRIVIEAGISAGGRLTELGAARAATPRRAGPQVTTTEPVAGRIAQRALAYVRGCTALLTGPGERTILTDHRLLPLSWTRDAYYQALLLLVDGSAEDAERVADHLRWLWRRCERPDGRWLRSHHANGRRKDLAFQADQQLYPMIELADFWRRAGTLPEGLDWTDAVATAWDAALGAVDPDVGLMASAENAADEPAEAPFIAASQVMLWYAAMRLAELCDAGAIGLDAAALRGLATATEVAFERHLVQGDRWAYATDAQGTRLAYHDANDLPIALAPLWGFCAADDRAWRGTMRFGFSPANPGFAGGPMPGLGSAHTAGAWTLGDVQAWLHAALIGDEAGARRAIDRLGQVAFADGMLPEAYAIQDGEGLVRVRHWFGWPGAAFAALWVLSEQGALEDRLQAAT